MNISELVKKPVEIVTENNISEDIIVPSDSIDKLVDKIIASHDNRTSDLSEFLVVYADNNYNIKGVITNREIQQLIQLVSEFDGDINGSVSSLGLDNKFPLKFFVAKEDNIEKVLTILNTGLTDIVIVQDANGKYLGKVKRSSLKKRLELLLS